MQKYQLSAGAILYALLLANKQSIYGVPNAMPSGQDQEFPAFAQEAEQELMSAGCGMLDFDGVFTLETDFLSLLEQCADCQEVVGISLRREGAWQWRTIYLGAEAVLERGEDLTCVLRQGKEPVAELLEALELPKTSPGQLKEMQIDTDLMGSRELKTIMESGCDEAQAALILDSLKGDGGYAHVAHTRDQSRIREYLFLYGKEGILKAEAEYTETQELLRLTPLASKDAEDLLRSLAGSSS